MRSNWAQNPKRFNIFNTSPILSVSCQEDLTFPWGHENKGSALSVYHLFSRARKKDFSLWFLWGDPVQNHPQNPAPASCLFSARKSRFEVPERWDFGKKIAWGRVGWTGQKKKEKGMRPHREWRDSFQASHSDRARVCGLGRASLHLAEQCPWHLVTCVQHWEIPLGTKSLHSKFRWAFKMHVMQSGKLINSLGAPCRVM